MPTGKVSWFDAEKGFGFLARDDGGDVFVHATALPPGTTALQKGQRVEFGVAEGKRGEQALQVRVLDPVPDVAARARRDPAELEVLVEDLVKLLDTTVLRDLRRGRQPERARAQRVAQLLRAVADELAG